MSEIDTERPEFGVAMVGYAFMGAAHSRAWETVSRVFDLPVQPVRRVIVGRDVNAAGRAARRLGWGEVTSDWRAVLERADIDVVDVCTPGDSHAEIAVAALEAGKHVICEKPLASTLAEAEVMADAAAVARVRGIRSLVGFNYRRVPALALARQLIAEGRLGRIYQVRAAYLQDWAADPASPLTWRMQRARAGSGALGDLGSHVVDLAQFLVGEDLVGVSGLEQTFVSERPLDGADGWGEVDVDDCAVFTGRFSGGGLATFEATRFALGRKNSLRVEVFGRSGSLSFDLETLNELHYYDRGDGVLAGFRRILVTEPEHPYMSAWWPTGHIIGWEHTFTHQAADFLQAVIAGQDPRPSFEDGLRVQRVLAAVSASAANESRWTAVPTAVGELLEVQR